MDDHSVDPPAQPLAQLHGIVILAFAYNAAAIPIAAGLLYPLLGPLLSPMLASAAMRLSSVSVIGNALRLRSVDLERSAPG